MDFLRQTLFVKTWCNTQVQWQIQIKLHTYSVKTWCNTQVQWQTQIQLQIHNRFCLIVERSPDKVLPNRQKVTKIPCILKAHPILSNTLGCSGRQKSCYTVQWFSEINLFTWFAWNAWDTDIGILNSSLPLHLNLKPRTSTYFMLHRHTIVRHRREKCTY